MFLRYSGFDALLILCWWHLPTCTNSPTWTWSSTPKASGIDLSRTSSANYMLFPCWRPCQLFPPIVTFFIALTGSHGRNNRTYLSNIDDQAGRSTDWRLAPRTQAFSNGLNVAESTHRRGGSTVSELSERKPRLSMLRFASFSDPAVGRIPAVEMHVRKVSTSSCVCGQNDPCYKESCDSSRMNDQSIYSLQTAHV